MTYTTQYLDDIAEEVGQYVQVDYEAIEPNGFGGYDINLADGRQLRLVPTDLEAGYVKLIIFNNPRAQLIVSEATFSHMPVSMIALVVRAYLTGQDL